MSPTNLADLPSTLVAPTGLIQLKRGASEGEIVWNNTVPAQPLQDGAGGQMFIDMTPTRRGWWLIRAESIWRVVEAVWISFDWSVRMNNYDLDGNYRADAYCSQHNALAWQGSVVDVAFRLEAGVFYRAYMHWEYSAGYNQAYYTGKDYHCIMGEFIGEGVA